MNTVAILTGPSTHLDHLGVLSALLNIPLIVTEEKTKELAHLFYPQINLEFKEIHELSIDYLATHYDVIFESGAFWACQLAPFIKLIHKKKIRFIYCPHGNSDKGASLKNHPEQDISLVYGDHLYDLLQANGSLAKTSKAIYTGNYRYQFYLEHKAFYDDLADKRVFSHFQQPKPTILYAPTWDANLQPSVFFADLERLIEQLKSDFNLLIKLHPFLIEDHPSYAFKISDQYSAHPFVLFLENFPAIYPLLERSDIYIGDTSSIGYDFLKFDRPLYFFNSTDPASKLHPCGIKIPPSQQGRLGNFIKETTDAQAVLSLIRQTTYAYAFRNLSASCWPLKIKNFV